MLLLTSVQSKHWRGEHLQSTAILAEPAANDQVVGWFLVYVTQSPRLLEQIRKEVDALPSASISTIDLKRAARKLLCLNQF